MRTALPILLLALAAIGLFILVVQQDDPAQRDEQDLEASDAPPTRQPSRAPARSTSPIEVVGLDRWPKELGPDSDRPEVSDPMLRKAGVEASDAAEWTPTGNAVLEALTTRLRDRRKRPTQGPPIKFRSQQELDEFRAAVWKDPLPGKVGVRSLLDSCRQIGYRAFGRSDGIYFVRIGDAEDS